jgi:hypothetical protein
MCRRAYLGHHSFQPQHGLLRRESSACIVLGTNVRCENQFKTYDHDLGSFNLEFLVNSLRLDEIVPQLLIVLIQPGIFENAAREVL